MISRKRRLAIKRRQRWIRKRVASGAGINRADITRQFSVCRSTAEADLARFRHQNPTALAPYSPSVKRHIPAAGWRVARGQWEAA